MTGCFFVVATGKHALIRFNVPSSINHAQPCLSRLNCPSRSPPAVSTIPLLTSLNTSFVLTGTTSTTLVVCPTPNSLPFIHAGTKDDTDFIEEADILTRPTTPDDTGLMHPLKAGEEEGTLVPAAQTIAPVVPDWVRTGRAFVPGIAYSTVPTHFLVVNPFLKPENEETGFAVVIVGKYVGVMAKLYVPFFQLRIIIRLKHNPGTMLSPVPTESLGATYAGSPPRRKP